MSLTLSRQVDADFPHLLQTNVGATCHQFTLTLIERLRADGHEAYSMCKSPGEGQYVPPGFQQRMVTGLDGKEYLCSGVSHDAIWCDGKQVDTIAGANEYDRFIYRKVTEPFWSFDPADGQKIVGLSIWNAIPQQFWRPNNPPLKEDVLVPPPVPPPVPPSFPYPDENTTVKAFQVRVKQAYTDAGRLFPDPNDQDAFRHFCRYGYSCHEMPEPVAADKHITELRRNLGLG